MTKEEEVLESLGIHTWIVLSNGELTSRHWYHIIPRRICKICDRIEYKSD